MTAGLRRGDEEGWAGPAPAEWIGPYRLIERLGEGGMGVVHLALAESGRAVAVKVLREHIAHDPDARSRLAREVQTLARVQNARVAAVLDADTSGPRPYIVTRYIPGPALDKVVSEHGPMQGEGLLRLGRGLAEALHAIHAAGVIHRDLKPANVLILDGDPVVIDFGIAHVADDIRLTMTGLVMGTPGYLSPEVVEGAPVAEATDWWGWAATLAFAASGTPPFGRGPMDVVLDRVRHGKADLSGVDPRLRPLLQAALSPEAAGRPHADEIVNALDRYAAGAPATVALPIAATRFDPVFDTLPQSPPHQQRPPRTEVLDRLHLAGEQDQLDGGEPDPQQAPVGQGAGEGGPGEPDPRIGRAPRIGTLLAVLAGVLGVAAIWPVVAIGLVVVFSWSARLADRSLTSVVVRRHENGRRRSDIPLAILAAPWHVLTSAIATIIALLLPAAVAVASTFSAAMAIAAVDGGDPQPDRSLPLVVGGFVALIMSWWGPGGASLRRGSRSLVRGMARDGALTGIFVTLLLILAAGMGLWAWVRLGQPDWWPWASGRFPGVPMLSR